MDIYYNFKGVFSMKKKLLTGVAVGVMMFGVAGIASATPFQWAASAGGNDNWYDAITPSSTISWEDARDTAVLSGWHLVTSTNWLCRNERMPLSPSQSPCCS